MNSNFFEVLIEFLQAFSFSLFLHLGKICFASPILVLFLINRKEDSHWNFYNCVLEAISNERLGFLPPVFHFLFRLLYFPRHPCRSFIFLLMGVRCFLQLSKRTRIIFVSSLSSSFSPLSESIRFPWFSCCLCCCCLLLLLLLLLSWKLARWQRLCP